MTYYAYECVFLFKVISQEYVIKNVVLNLCWLYLFSDSSGDFSQGSGKLIKCIYNRDGLKFLIPGILTPPPNPQFKPFLLLHKSTLQ